MDYVFLAAFVIGPIVALPSSFLFGVNLRRYVDSGKKPYLNRAILYGGIFVLVCALNAGIFITNKLN